MDRDTEGFLRSYSVDLLTGRRLRTASEPKRDLREQMRIVDELGEVVRSDLGEDSFVQ